MFAQLYVLYTVDLDVKMVNRRVRFEDENTTTSGKLLVSENTCAELQLHTLVGDIGQTAWNTLSRGCHGSQM